MLKLVKMHVIVKILVQLFLKVMELCFFGAVTNKVDKRLATFRNYIYLCNVRMYVLSIRVESRVG